MMSRRHVSGLIVLAIVAGACSDDTAPAPAARLQDYIPGVVLTTAWIFPEEPNTLSVAAVYHAGDAPRPSLGPVIFGCQYDTLEPRLSAGVSFDCLSGAFSRGPLLTSIFVWLAETPGYWELTLPEPKGSETNGINLSYRIDFAEDAPPGPVNLRLTGLDTDGNVGAIVTQRVEVIAPPPVDANPDVRTLLTWTGPGDLDLHVVDPFGHDVSVFNPTTSEGGHFGGDSNGACIIGGTNRESIEWPAGTAPKGEYRVYVSYYNDCETASSPFSVQVDIQGQDRQQVNDMFDGPSTSSTPRTVATFVIR